MHQIVKREIFSLCFMTGIMLAIVVPFAPTFIYDVLIMIGVIGGTSLVESMIKASRDSPLRRVLVPGQLDLLVSFYQEKARAWNRQDDAGTAEYEDVEFFEREIRKILFSTFLDHDKWTEDDLVEVSQADFGTERREVLDCLQTTFQ
jgi:hypothetical protein